MRRVGHLSKLVLVVVTALACPAVLAQVADGEGQCCPRGYVIGRVSLSFELGTPVDRTAEIVAALDVQVNDFSDSFIGPRYSLCVPSGEESAIIEMLETHAEVRHVFRSGYGSATGCRLCTCCICGFDCDRPDLIGYLPCETECEHDADADRFSDYCDTCTDTDGDGYGDPEYEYNPVGFRTSICPIDNCPQAPNSDQSDLDADGIGDACDRTLTICHKPPGKPAPAHTIEVSVRAVPAHLAHGDFPGSCAMK